MHRGWGWCGDSHWGGRQRARRKPCDRAEACQAQRQQSEDGKPDQHRSAPQHDEGGPGRDGRCIGQGPVALDAPLFQPQVAAQPALRANGGGVGSNTG